MRCAACGNLTRFDIVTTERVRRFWHAELSGSGTIDEEIRDQVTVESITCRWCSSQDAIEFVETPAGGEQAVQSG